MTMKKNLQLQGHFFVNVKWQLDATSWTSQRHESGLIPSQTLWKMSDDFNKALAMIRGKMLP